MVHRLLSALALLFLASASIAQDPPSQAPPLPDEPAYWQVHDANGPMDLQIVVTYVETVGNTDVYFFGVFGTLNGQSYTSSGWIWDSGDGTELDVWSADSELWSKWKWDGDHYDKVGGTANRRSYHPVY